METALKRLLIGVGNTALFSMPLTAISKDKKKTPVIGVRR